MEAGAESWLFAVFIWVIVLMLIIPAIGELWKRRNKPVNPRTKK
jgi:hypothetical protein